jgi:ATP-dependent Lon protease
VICEFHPFKPYKVDLEYFKYQRKNFTIDEWIDLLICSMEYNPKSFDSLSQKLLFITRLLVFIEPNLNIIELAPKGTGKSYVFGNLSKYAWMFSGGTVSRAKLLYDIARSVPGIITKFDIIAFDEIETIKFSNEEELQGALKSYLESGTFSLANFKGVSQASFMLLGNIPLTNSRRPISKKYFSKLPDFFQHSALLDRFHGFIEGWKLPRMKNDMILDGFALNMEYFSEILHELRAVSDYSYFVNEMLNIPQKADTRDTRAIIKIATAYLKLLFPHISSPNELDRINFKTFCLEPAKKMRQIIKIQLNLIDSEFKSEIPDITIH